MPASDPTTAAQLAARIDDGSVVVGVIGLGYVGLPLAKAFVDAGIRVVGFDVDEAKITALADRITYLTHLDPDLAATLRDSGLFEATTDFARLREPDAILICVPTPLGPHREPDLSYVEGTVRNQVAPALRPGQLVVLESTTYPGTTRDVVLPPLADAGASRGITPGENLFVAFSPEREDPGRQGHTTRTIPKLVGGLDDDSTTLAAALYRKAVAEVVEVGSAEVAEAAKLLENIYRAVNIALVNELKVLLTEMGVDVWQVIEAAATKPFGFQRFDPGPGLGGHCIPVDPFYLTWKAREVGRETRFIELAGEINHAMPVYVVDRVAEALNTPPTGAAPKPLRGSKVLVLGVAYKPNVDDVRESPAFELISLLKARGAEVAYHDPHVRVAKRERVGGFDAMESVPLTAEVLGSHDVALVATHHAAIDWDLVATHAPLIVDTRNVMAGRSAAVGKTVLA